MINLLDYRPVNRKECERILKVLQDIGNKNPNLKGFTIYPEKNDRGNYGYNDIYSYKKTVFLIVSFDSARIDTKYYFSPNIEEIIKLVKTDSQKHL